LPSKASFDLGEGNGSLYEMDITTNRVDAMNHYGVAREAAAIYGLSLPELGVCALPESRPSARPFRADRGRRCLRPLYGARAARQSRSANRATGFRRRSRHLLCLLEQKKISNAVDATNFAWLAMGQPTHAFDLDKIEGGIVVRRARKGEKLKTLDGVERVLDAEDLVVADHAKPLGLAGVMGGWDTMITPRRRTCSSKRRGLSPWPCAHSAAPRPAHRCQPSL
jgi:phenylalanyl-tRNA synthetase beta chain